MASRRSLLSRQQRDAGSPNVHRSHQNRDSGSHAQQSRIPTALPPYEPPSCPLTESAKRSLANISENHDYRNYQKHLKIAVTNITNFAGESNDRLFNNKEKVKRMAQKREAAQDDSEKTEEEEQAEQRAREMEEEVERLTKESEKALRDLIDYKYELAAQNGLLRTVSDKVTAAPTPPDIRAARRGRRRSSHDREDSDEGINLPEDAEMRDGPLEATTLSPTELLMKAKMEYQATYTSKSMYIRYAEDNDYIGFKRVIHDAHNPGDNAPPVPSASSWFPDEVDGANSNPFAARRRRLASQTDNTENGDDDDDDEIQMTGVISSLKCPLTLQTFKEPYSNRKCKHTFEKTAILQFHRENAVSFVDPSQGGRRERGVPTGPKQLKCPERGCDAMLELDDFYTDHLIIRQVKRQQAQAAADFEDDPGERIDTKPTATQRNRHQDIKRRSVKEERKGRVPSQTRAASTSESEDGDPEPIDMED